MPSSACDWSSDVCSSDRSEEHTSELQSRSDLVCRLLLEKKKALLASLESRTIGPFRDGRTDSDSGYPLNLQVFYFGSNGGVFCNPTDHGVYWYNISDGIV